MKIISIFCSGIRNFALALILVSGTAKTLAAEGDLDASIAKNRMGTLIIQTTPGAQVSVEQLRHEFWFGATLPGKIFTGEARPEDAAKFKEVFIHLFNSGVMETSLKWASMEPKRGQVNYSAVDAILTWADQNKIPLRGHCLFWGVPHFVQDWVKQLPDDELRQALQQRAKSTGTRYRNRFTEYDLNNEMLHANYYEQRLGPEITRQMAQWVREADPNAKLFVNDYDILTGNRLADYVNEIQHLQALGVPISGIGVQGHYHGESFDPVALQNALDELAKLKLPVRVTEFNFPGQRSKYFQKEGKGLQLTPVEEQAKAEALRQYYRICFAHPAVTGILMWGFWEGMNWIPQSALYKRDWTPTPALAAYRDLVFNKWWTKWKGVAGPDGRVEVRVFYGQHRVTVNGRELVVTLSKAEGAKQLKLTTKT